MARAFVGVVVALCYACGGHGMPAYVAFCQVAQGHPPLTQHLLRAVVASLPSSGKFGGEARSTCGGNRKSEGWPIGACSAQLAQVALLRGGGIMLAVWLGSTVQNQLQELSAPEAPLLFQLPKLRAALPRISGMLSLLGASRRPPPPPIEFLRPPNRSVPRSFPMDIQQPVVALCRSAGCHVSCSEHRVMAVAPAHGPRAAGGVSLSMSHLAVELPSEEADERPSASRRWSASFCVCVCAQAATRSGVAPPPHGRSRGR